MTALYSRSIRVHPSLLLHDEHPHRVRRGAGRVRDEEIFVADRYPGRLIRRNRGLELRVGPRSILGDEHLNRGPVPRVDLDLELPLREDSERGQHPGGRTRRDADLADQDHATVAFTNAVGRVTANATRSSARMATMLRMKKSACESVIVTVVCSRSQRTAFLKSPTSAVPAVIASVSTIGRPHRVRGP